MQSEQFLKSTLELIKTLAVVFIIAFVLKTFLIQTFVIEGQSMEPNFHNGQYLLIDKLSYRFKEPTRGDVVILIPPDDSTKDYIKRVIGRPGDTVEIVHNQVKVNGQIIPEPYLNQGEETQVMDSDLQDYKTTLGQDQYFVLGDNRKNSRDSRSIGTIPKGNIVGRALFVFLPINQAHFLHHITY
jgi:signal peptidase I